MSALQALLERNDREFYLGDWVPRGIRKFCAAVAQQNDVPAEVVFLGLLAKITCLVSDFELNDGRQRFHLRNGFQIGGENGIGNFLQTFVFASQEKLLRKGMAV